MTDKQITLLKIKCQCWVFGVCELGNHGKFYVWVVNNRKAETIMPLILNVASPGVRVVTDGGPCYNTAQLANAGMIHDKYDHS